MTKRSKIKLDELIRKRKNQTARPFRKGEKVMVISGRSKGKYGSLLALARKDRALVEGLNMTVGHVKDRGEGTGRTGRVEKENPIHISNLAAACPHCAMPTRPRTKVVVTEVDGVRKKEKTRYCHRCGEPLTAGTKR